MQIITFVSYDDLLMTYLCTLLFCLQRDYRYINQLSCRFSNHILHTYLIDRKKGGLLLASQRRVEFFIPLLTTMSTTHYIYSRYGHHKIMIFIQCWQFDGSTHWWRRWRHITGHVHMILSQVSIYNTLSPANGNDHEACVNTSLFNHWCARRERGHGTDATTRSSMGTRPVLKIVCFMGGYTTTNESRTIVWFRWSNRMIPFPDRNKKYSTMSRCLFLIVWKHTHM